MSEYPKGYHPLGMGTRAQAEEDRDLLRRHGIPAVIHDLGENLEDELMAEPCVPEKDVDRAYAIMRKYDDRDYKEKCVLDMEAQDVKDSAEGKPFEEESRA